jgi:hypothetical protein
VFRQNAAAERFDFTERDGLETARALQPETEAANAGKQVQHPELGIFRHASTQSLEGALLSLPSVP